MKKLLLTLFVSVAFGVNGFSQCTPDMQYAGDDGIHPDSAQGFAVAYAGTPYLQNITVVVPADTCVQILPPPMPCSVLTFDSIVVTSVTGLPATFLFDCAPANCVFLGNTIDCAYISGNPILADTGVHNLVFNVDAYVGGFGTPNSFTIDYYKLVVLPPLSVNENVRVSAVSNKPNPFSEQTTIEFYAEKSESVSIEIFNAFGQVIYSKNISALRGMNTISFSAADVPNGTYFYRITSSGGSVTKRMVINK